jgi:hypothetical protein
MEYSWNINFPWKISSDMAKYLMMCHGIFHQSNEGFKTKENKKMHFIIPSVTNNQNVYE